MADNDELIAAEAEYQAKKRQRHHSEDGWAEAQPDAGLPAKRDDADDGAAPAPAEEPSKKKPRLTDEDKKRGNRMFGAMMGTLSRFKDDTAKTRQTDAARRRQEVEQRLQEKLKAESEALHKKRELELEERTLRQTVTRKTEEIGSLDEIYATRHAAKLALANFLCTSPSQPLAADRYHAASILPSHPHSLAVGSAIRDPGPKGQRPLYWLPAKLTTEQKEQIERQRQEVRDAVRAQKEDWRDEKDERQATLENDRVRRDTRVAEIQAQRQSDIRNHPDRPRRGSPDVKRPESEAAAAAEDVVKRDSSVAMAERERSEHVEMEDARGDEDAVEY